MAFLFQLTRATVREDGLAVRLRFEAGVSVGQPACNLATQTGYADHLPSLRTLPAPAFSGSRTGEVLNVWTSVANMGPPSTAWSSSGGGTWNTPNGGYGYNFRLVVVDASGNEIYTGLPNITNDSFNAYTSNRYGSSTNYPPSPGSSLTLTWDSDRPVPVGGKLRVYGYNNQPNLTGSATDKTDNHDTDLLNHQYLVAEATSGWFVAANGDWGYTLTGFPASLTGLKTPDYGVTCWYADVLVSSPILWSETPTITLPDGLISDALGNRTAAVINYPLANRSVVGSDGFMDPTKWTFAKTYYVSKLGSDSNAGTSLTAPFLTVTKAWNTAKALPAGTTFRICLRRGDMFTGESLTGGLTGVSAASPSLIDNYWNPTDGADPGLRPILFSQQPQATVTNIYPADSGLFSGYNGLAFPYSWLNWRGIYFLCETQSGHQYLPIANGHGVILSDCVFHSAELIAEGSDTGYHMKTFVLHRSTIFDLGGVNMAGAVQLGTSGTTLVLPPYAMTPYLSADATKNTTGQNLLTLGESWNVSNTPQIGWTVTVQDGNGNTDGPFTINAIASVKSSLGTCVQLTLSGNLAHTYDGNAAVGGVYPSASLIPPVGQQLRIVNFPNTVPGHAGYNGDSAIAIGQATSVGTFTIASYNAATTTATLTSSIPGTPQFGSQRWMVAFQPWVGQGLLVSGLFSASCDDLLLSQNVFDYCGWYDIEAKGTANDSLNHCVYSQYSNAFPFVWGNDFTAGEDNGCMNRGGGTQAYNLHFKNGDSGVVADNGGIHKSIYIGNGSSAAQISHGYEGLGGQQTIEFCIILQSGGFTSNRVASTYYDSYVGIYSSTNSPYWQMVRHNTTYLGGHFQLSGAAKTRLTFQNNIHVHGLQFGHADSNGQWGWLLKSSVNLATLIQGDNNWYAFNAGWTNPWNSGGIGQAAFSAWQKQGGTSAVVDANSVVGNVAPAFVNGSYDMGAWAAQNGISSAESDWRTQRKVRPAGVWRTFDDPVARYNAFAAAYTPTLVSVPGVGVLGQDYVGVTDNRTGVLLYSLGAVLASAGIVAPVTLVIAPSAASTETLSVSVSGADGPSSMTFSGSSPTNLSILPTQPGPVTVALARGATNLLTLNYTAQPYSTGAGPLKTGISVPLGARASDFLRVGAN